MEETFKTRQLSEYKTLSDGRSGCLFFVGPEEQIRWREGRIVWGTDPKVYFLEAPWREEDKAPYVNELHEKERTILKSTKPLLSGYSAWYVAMRLSSDFKHEHTPSYEEYLKQYTDALGPAYSPNDDEVDQYRKAQRDRNLFVELLGEDEWYRTSTCWARAIMDYQSDQYKNMNHMTDNGDLDYTKALFDDSWDHNHPSCRIKVEDDKELEFMMDFGCPCVTLYKDTEQYMFDNEDKWREEGMSEEEMEDACEELYDEENNQYYSWGFIVALLNLARNVKVERFIPDYSFYSNPDKYYSSLGPDLGIDQLGFDFDIATKTLCEAYLNRIEVKYREEEEKNPEVLYADMHEIYIKILREERRHESWFFEKEYKYLLTDKQQEKIKSYCKSFQRFLVDKIGFDPGEEKVVEEAQEVLPAELCEYISKEGVAKVGVKTAEDVEKELSQASSRKAPEFAKLLRSNEKVGYLDFKGHEKKTVYENLKKHFGNMDYTYKNFVAYF